VCTDLAGVARADGGSLVVAGPALHARVLGAFTSGGADAGV
jgi:hypothetical protein